MPLPLLTISVPGYPTIVVQVRDADDAVAFSLAAGRPRQAVERAMQGWRSLRAVQPEDVVEEYLVRLLREDRPDGVHEAAACCEKLLGKEVEVWEKWVGTFGKVPGGVVALWPYLPVRGEQIRTRRVTFLV